MMKLILNTLLVFLFLNTIISCKDDEETQIVPTQLNALTSSVSFSSDSSTLYVKIYCNKSWVVSDTSDWCVVSGDSKSDTGTIAIHADINKKIDTRTTYLSVVSEDSTVYIKVSQTGTIYADRIAPDSTDMISSTVSSLTFSLEMIPGWNLGNSLEATGGETSWGNPLVTQQLIDSVKAAGFKAIRIPVAWSKFTDTSNYTIRTSWMDRVEEVVNYALKDDMYAIINIHWDGGWMVPKNSQKVYVNNRLSKMWHQIALRFRDYGTKLLFAGTNEVMVNYNAPSKEYYTVQNSFNQTFVNTVRATGGKNYYRYLIVQGYNTNIDYTNSYLTIPTDSVKKKLMVEVHYYDPYNFSLNTSTTYSQWGKNYTDASKKDTWGDESYADAQFQKMMSKYCYSGYGVILGEYGAISKLTVAEHTEFRRYYYEYITQSAVNHRLIPFVWDNGVTTNNGLGLFYRYSGSDYYPAIVKAITSAKIN
jgi:endoglucanase